MSSVETDTVDAPVRAIRRIVLMRHAKSDWPVGVADHERPLGQRGRSEAPLAGRWLAAAGLVPERVVVSSARRTRETWDLVAHEIGAGADGVEIDERLYGAGALALLEVIRETDAEVATLMLVGHNPGTEVLAMALDDGRGHVADRARMAGKFPTSGIACLHVPGAWGEVETGSCRLAAFAVAR